MDRKETRKRQAREMLRQVEVVDESTDIYVHVYTRTHTLERKTKSCLHGQLNPAVEIPCDKKFTHRIGPSQESSQDHDLNYKGSPL